ncbi:iron ABC transporter permease [Rhizobium sp. WL3]|uniref:FecCD family ABC transporter permease n=1 Tax=Rhizobium sp. WL3 TaxID=2603277 RepID=UPI0011C1D467|nr:iron ABC transporter permease [Rhizobium sp. WL3]QEE47846.1 iron ABC transporter permease [Rhizobium sp. WL3]
MIASSRGRQARRRQALLASMLVLVLLGFFMTLMAGQTFTPLADVVHVLMGESVPGADFTVGQLRLPRAILAIVAGVSFGLGGAAFQTMLRNPLASPDIIGITSGASAAAVFAIVILSLSGPAVSLLAVGAGLAVALLVYGLSAKNGVAGSRLILVGIGISAMLESMIAYVLSRAPAFTLQEAMRWLTGSLNGAKLEQSLPVMASLLVFGALILLKARDLEAMRTGDETATALGVNVPATRLIVMISAVGLIATATAVTGPIAFVAFLAGPIATGMFGRRSSILLPAGMVGAVLVLIGDFVGQFLLPGRYPVGVVTGALGAPYLISLIIRNNRRGGTP